MAEEMPPTKPPRTSLVDSGWADDEVDALTSAPLVEPAAPPKPNRLPRPAIPRVSPAGAPPAPSAPRPPPPPRAAVESLTEAANLLDELDETQTEDVFPIGSDFVAQPARPRSVPPEPAPGASGILPRFAMPSESDASSPRIVNLEEPAPAGAAIAPDAVGELPPPSALPAPPAPPAVPEVFSAEPSAEPPSALPAPPAAPPAMPEVFSAEPSGAAGPSAASAAEAAPEAAPEPSTRPLRVADFPGALSIGDPVQQLPQGSDIPSLPPVHAASSALGLGEALTEPVRIGGANPPLWAALMAPAAVLLFTGLGLGALLFGGSAPEQAAAAAPSAVQAQASAEPAGSADPAAASPSAAAAPSAASAPAVASAQPDAETPAGEQTAAQAIALARGRSAQLRSEWRTFMDAIKADPEQFADKAKRKQLEEYARNRELSTDTLEEVAAIGSEGALDFLYEIWIGTPKRTETTQLAEELVTSKDLKQKASPALAVALALRAHEKDQPCEQVQALVVQAGKVGDTRSLHLLGRLANRRGCGSSGRDDCYPCLRTGDVLKQAITDVRSRL